MHGYLSFIIYFLQLQLLGSLLRSHLDSTPLRDFSMCVRGELHPKPQIPNPVVAAQDGDMEGLGSHTVPG